MRWPCRQLDVGEAPVDVGGLVGQADIGQQSANMLRIDTLQAVEPVEQVEVGVDGGEQVAVARRVVGIDQRAVPQDGAGLRAVELGQHTGQRRLPAAVAAHHEDGLSRIYCKVAGAEGDEDAPSRPRCE